MLKNIIDIISDAKAKNILSIDLQKIDSAICKYFIVCSANSSTHSKSIEKKITKKYPKILERNLTVLRVHK